MEAGRQGPSLQVLAETNEILAASSFSGQQCQGAGVVILEPLETVVDLFKSFSVKVVGRRVVEIICVESLQS